LADYQPLQPSNLKAIFLAAAARYGSLDLRIPSTKDDSGLMEPKNPIFPFP
ncbi:Hypothetical protein FKW44_000449, partial [Caligus rogercresseyi]